MNVSPPLAVHMRETHRGCRAPTYRGYDRTGTYRHADPIPSTADSPIPVCGQLVEGTLNHFKNYAQLKYTIHYSPIG